MQRSSAKEPARQSFDMVIEIGIKSPSLRKGSQGRRATQGLMPAPSGADTTGVRRHKMRRVSLTP